MRKLSTLRFWKIYLIKSSRKGLLSRFIHSLSPFEGEASSYIYALTNSVCPYNIKLSRTLQQLQQMQTKETTPKSLSNHPTSHRGFVQKYLSIPIHGAFTGLCFAAIASPIGVHRCKLYSKLCTTLPTNTAASRDSCPGPGTEEGTALAISLPLLILPVPSYAFPGIILGYPSCS